MRGQTRLSSVTAKAMILAFHERYGRWPTASKCKDDNERHLANVLYRFHSSSRESSRDPVFIEHIKALGWESREDKVSTRKKEIWVFHSTHKRFPRRDSADEEESKLGGFFLGYTCTTHSSFDPDFLLLAIKRGYRPQSNARTWNVPELVVAFREAAK